MEMYNTAPDRHAESFYSKQIDLSNVSNINVLCWDKFVRLTRLDDDSEWHDQLARTYCEEEFKRKRKENVTKKRSKSDTNTRHLPSQESQGVGSSANSSEKEKKFVRQNSTNYRHSLPGIVENGVYKDTTAQRQSHTIETYIAVDQGTVHLDKKSVSLSDLRNVNQSSNRIMSKLTSTAKSQENLSMVRDQLGRYQRPEAAPLREGISQRVSNVKRMLRLNGLMHAE